MRKYSCIKLTVLGICKLLIGINLINVDTFKKVVASPKCAPPQAIYAAACSYGASVVR